jgi:hypothetical protein
LSGCRIRSVTDKRTGRRIEVLPSRKRDGHAAKLIQHAAEIADAFEGGEMAGFLVFAFDAKGLYNCGYRLPKQADMPFSRSVLPALIEEIVRREVIIEADMRDFSFRHGWLIP